MERAEPDRLLGGERLNARSHLLSRLVRERQGEDLVIGDALPEQVGHAMGDDTGLAAPRAGQDQQRAVDVLHCLALGVGKAFKEVFPEASDTMLLSPKSRSSRVPQVLEIQNGEALQGYGVQLEVVSRSGPFLILVAVSVDETVMDVQIPKYPHQRGRGVKKTMFLEQFKGVSYGEPLKLGGEDAARHSVMGTAGSQGLEVTYIACLRGERMYILQVTVDKWATSSEKRSADEFLGSFVFLK